MAAWAFTFISFIYFHLIFVCSIFIFVVGPITDKGTSENSLEVQYFLLQATYELFVYALFNHAVDSSGCIDCDYVISNDWH